MRSQFSLFLCVCVHTYEKHLLTSSCLSVCMDQIMSHWTDFCEIWYWGLLWKSVKKILIWLKIEQKYWALCVKTYILCCQWQSHHKHCWQWHLVQQDKRNTDVDFLAKVFSTDYIFHRDMYVNSAKENAALCQWQQWLCEHAKMWHMWEPEFDSKNSSQCMIEVKLWFLIF
jgi:hypothetical protein